MLLFKYINGRGVRGMLPAPGSLSLRFSSPRDYNDPYELFLQPDSALDDEDEAAFYEYFLGHVVSLPVTCFSRRPDLVTMWAHYSAEGSGVCVAFDEDRLADEFEFAFVDDVAYSETPAQIPTHMITWALTTGKRRHALRMLEVGHKAAYFVKRADWNYEQERRLVVLPNELEQRARRWVKNVDPKVVSTLILGARVSKATRTVCMDWARDSGAQILQLQIGRRSYMPFFKSTEGRTLVWSGSEFIEPEETCEECCEPISTDASKPLPRDEERNPLED